MMMANTTAEITTFGVIRKLNTASLNVTGLFVPVVIPLNGSIKTMPTAAPSIDNNTDSKTNEVRMLDREKPITRNVAISRDRYATAAYIVFIAAKQEPIAMMIATRVPTNLMGLPLLVCFAQYSVSSMPFNLSRWSSLTRFFNASAETGSVARINAELYVGRSKSDDN